MNPERHALVKDIFSEALALPPNDRPAFLARRCAGTEGLRSEVERLLDLASDFRELRPVEPATGELAGTRLCEPDPRRDQAPGLENLVAGEIVASRYRIVTWLGSGGMGTVYRADDTVLNQPIAIKFLDETLADNSIWISRFRHEARLARQITHPNVCRVFDIEEADGIPFLTMEYVDGENLATLLKRIGRVEAERGYQICHDICIGLAAVHRAAVIHRDLKPANVMLDARGAVRLADFGLAGLAEHFVSSAVPAGTPAYMAPEQFSGSAVTERTDIYCLGLVMYELLSGRPAIGARTISEYMEAHCHLRPERLHLLVPAIAGGVSNTIMQCLEKEPDDRPASALEVAAAFPGADVLRAALEVQQTPPPALVAAASPRFPRVQPKVLAAAVLVLLACLWFLRGVLPAPWENRASKPPAVLLEHTQRLANALSPGATREFEAHGYCSAPTACAVLHDQLSAFPSGVVPRLATSAEAVFWYRGSPSPLTPMQADNLLLGSSRVGPADPPSFQVGSTFVVLDPTGRALAFATPEEPWAPPASDSRLSAAWDALAAAAEVESLGKPDPAVSTIPTTIVGSAKADPKGDGNDVSLHVRQSGGRVRSFAVAPKSAVESAAEDSSQENREAVAFASLRLAFLLITIFSLPWAWKNVREERCDVPNALRVAGLTFVLLLANWLLQATWSGRIPTLVLSCCIAVIRCTGFAALAGAFYVAAEPFVRKTWPHLLTTWNRALALRVRDPVVAHSVLAGAGFGCLLALVYWAERVLAFELGLPISALIVPDRVYDGMLGGRLALGGMLGAAVTAVLEGFLVLLLAAALRALVRDPKAAMIAAGVLLAPIVISRGAHWATSIPLLGGAFAAACMFALVRYGLLTIIVAFWTRIILSTSPLTVDPSAWYADHTLLALALVLALTSYGLLGSGARIGRLEPGTRS